MDLSRPFSAVVPTLEGDVLVALAGTTQPLTGVRVSQLVRRGKERGVSKALDRLVAQGLVERQHAGRAYLHTLNRNHLAAPAVEILAGLRTELFRRLVDELRQWRPQPLHASVFGSAARGDGGVDSDIDLLLVRPVEIGEEHPEWRDRVETLAVEVKAWTGNYAGIVELSEDELRMFPATEPAVFDELRRDAVDIAGEPLRSLLPLPT